MRFLEFVKGKKVTIFAPSISLGAMMLLRDYCEKVKILTCNINNVMDFLAFEKLLETKVDVKHYKGMSSRFLAFTDDEAVECLCAERYTSSLLRELDVAISPRNALCDKCEAYFMACVNRMVADGSFLEDYFRGKLITDIPLYVVDRENRRLKAPKSSGINWIDMGERVGCLTIRKSNIVGVSFISPIKIVGETCCRDEIGDGVAACAPIFENEINKRNVELIWDDGWLMEGYFEKDGYNIGGFIYPKQLMSANTYDSIGAYLRRRMGKDTDCVISYNDLAEYGRRDVVMVKIDEGTYYMYFDESEFPNGFRVI